MAEVKLEDAVKKAREFVEETDMTAEERVECRQMAEWLEHYQLIVTTEAPALEVACEALRRMADKAELGEDAKTPAVKHHANRINKLIGNLEELIALETKE